MFFLGGSLGGGGISLLILVFNGFIFYFSVLEKNQEVKMYF